MVQNVLRILLIVAVIALGFWFLIEIQTIIIYVVVSWVVALIGRPLFKLLDQVSVRGRHLPAAVKSALTLIFILAVLVLTIGIFMPLIFDEARRLSSIDVASVKNSLQPAVASIKSVGEKYGIEPLRQINESQISNYVFDSVNFSAIPTLLNSALSIFGNLLVATFSVAFISFFFLKDKAMVTDVIMLITPKSKEASAKRIILNTRQTLSRYFLGLLLQITAITICVYIGLSFLGIQNALLIAFFSGLANLIPYLGPWIGAFFAMFIVVSNNISASFTDVVQPKLMGLVVVYAITQMLDNYIFQPTIFSNSIHAHPLEIFLVILIAGTLGGVMGMVIAIPLYAFARIVFIEMNREFGFIERLKAR